MRGARFLFDKDEEEEEDKENEKERAEWLLVVLCSSQEE
jgi:hypothetical protein